MSFKPPPAATQVTGRRMKSRRGIADVALTDPPPAPGGGQELHRPWALANGNPIDAAMPEFHQVHGASTSIRMPVAAWLLCNSQSAFRPGSGAMIRQARQRFVHVFCRCDANGQAGTPRSERCRFVDALASHRKWSAAPCWIAPADGRERGRSPAGLVAEARKLQAAGVSGERNACSTTPATPPAQRDQDGHQRVMAPLGVQAQWRSVGSCSTARLHTCPPSTNRRLGDAPGGVAAKPGQPRASRASKQPRPAASKSSRWLLASNGSESAGADGGMGQIKSRKEAAFTPRRPGCSQLPQAPA